MISQNNFINILRQTELRISQLKIFGDGQTKITIIDPSKPKSQQKREGDYFVSLPDKLTHVLPGSYLPTTDFLEELELSHSVDYLTNCRLNTGYFGNETNPAFFNFSNEGNFSLKVLHGFENPQSLKLSELATQKFNSPQVRAEYQQNLFETMKPVIKIVSRAKIRIIEDCLASGDTLVGLIMVLSANKNIGPKEKIRIDVAVAATQGILVLKEFARRNNLKLELNIGYLANGLSKGKAVTGFPGAKTGANYIIYPKEVKEKYGITYDFVVGDMGDASEILPGDYNDACPWNKYRIEQQRDIDPSLPTLIFLTNGGYLMQAYYRYLYPENKNPELVLSAKRVWAPKPHGYGVLLEGIN